mmetsp:Transcript_32639/g.58960  ORF Transcript_32639/g.58960 Transcript_32639/m.58960 type:complete len:248 (-) Transcript_32639:34-777(-)
MSQKQSASLRSPWRKPKTAAKPSSTSSSAPPRRETPRSFTSSTSFCSSASLRQMVILTVKSDLRILIFWWMLQLACRASLASRLQWLRSSALQTTRLKLAMHSLLPLTPISLATSTLIIFSTTSTPTSARRRPASRPNRRRARWITVQKISKHGSSQPALADTAWNTRSSTISCFTASQRLTLMVMVALVRRPLMFSSMLPQRPQGALDLLHQRMKHTATKHSRRLLVRQCSTRCMMKQGTSILRHG